MRIDSELASALKGEGEKMESEALTELFKKVSGNEKLKVEFENLADKSIPAVLSVSEESRRFDDMMRMYSGGAERASIAEETLVLNSSSELIRRLAEKPDEKVAKQLYTLTLLSRRRLTAEELTEFLGAGYEMLTELLK
jgi:molecular chaperone HtpG